MSNQILVEQFLQEQDEKKQLKIRNEIIKSNIPLVHDVIQKKFYNSAEDKDDLVQIGLLGVNKALNYYNPAKGKFSTLAHKAISDNIIVMLKKNKEAFGGKNKYKYTRLIDFDLSQIPSKQESKGVFEAVDKVFGKLPERDVENLKKKFGFIEGKASFFQEKKSLARFRSEMKAQGIKRSDFYN